MKSTGFSRMATCCIAVLSVLSCIREEYTVSEENLNLEVTVFQDGVHIPLGSTDSLKVKDLLETFGQGDSSEYLQYLKTIGSDGAYAFGMSETMDFSESLDELEALKDQIRIEGVSVQEKVSFNLSSVDVSGFMVEGRDHVVDYDLGSVMGDFSMKSPSIDPFNMKLTAGLGDYLPDLSCFDSGLDKEPFEVNVELGHLDGLDQLPSGLESLIGSDAYNAPIPIDPAKGLRYVNPITGEPLLSVSPMLISLETEPYTIDMSMDLPEGLTSVDKIVMKEGASVVVTVAVENSLFTEGRILPHMDFDVHEIFHLADEENQGRDELTTDHIIADFDLKADGARITKSYKVKSLNVSKTDIKDGKLQISRDISLSDESFLDYEGLATTLKKLAESDGKPMNIYLSLSFENFEIDHVEFTVSKDNAVTLETSREIPLKMDFDVPEDVVSNVNYVRFARTMPASGEKEGNVHLSLSASNVMDFMQLGLESLEFTFPDELVVEGAVNGKVTYQVADLTKGLDEYLFIKEIRLPQPVGGKISIDEQIAVTAKASASVHGSVNSAELAAAKDVVVDVRVDGNLGLDDYEVVVKGFDYEVGQTYLIEEKLPDEMKDFDGDVTIYLKDLPQLRIAMEYPPVDVPVVAGKGGLKISFPEMLKFDEGVRTLAFAEGEEIPSEIVLGIDRIVVSPVTREDGIYVVGEFSMTGNVGIKEGQKVHKSDIDILTGSDHKARRVRISVEIPDLVPANVAVDTYSAAIAEEFGFDLLSAEDIPEMIVSIGEVEFEDVYIDFGIDASELVSKLGGAQLSFSCDVTIPDYIVLEGVDPIMDKENGTQSIPLEAKADADGKIMMEPIKVKALDLTGVVESGEGLKGSIAVAGNATLTNASIDVDDLKDGDALSVALTGGISGGGEDGAITISKASAKVDYQLDPVAYVVDLSGVREALDQEGLTVDLALSHVHLALDLVTNLGISAGADVSIVPYYADVPAEPVTCSLEIAAPETVGELKHSRYWLGEDASCAPEGYAFRQIPILELFRNVPDSLEITLAAATDKDAVCVLDTKTDYVLSVDYSVEIPLQFDEEFNIGFTCTIPEIPEIVSTIFEYGSLAVVGEALCGLPIGLEATAELLDSEGHIIPLEENAGRLTIKPCVGIGKASSTDVNLLFGKKKGSSPREISAIRLTFEANAVSVPLTEDSFIKLELQALVPEGITVDLKDFMSDGKNGGK